MAEAIGTPLSNAAAASTPPGLGNFQSPLAQRTNPRANDLSNGHVHVLNSPPSPFSAEPDVDTPMSSNTPSTVPSQNGCANFPLLNLVCRLEEKLSLQTVLPSQQCA